MILRCSCIHKGQDKLHGEKRRVHNKTSKGTWRCTVCGSEKNG